MLGKNLINELDKFVGELSTIAMNDVIFSGRIEQLSKNERSAKYSAGQVLFLIYLEKEYRLDIQEVFINIEGV